MFDRNAVGRHVICIEIDALRNRVFADQLQCRLHEADRAALAGNATCQRDGSSPPSTAACQGWRKMADARQREDDLPHQARDLRLISSSMLAALSRCNPHSATALSMGNEDESANFRAP